MTPQRSPRCASPSQKPFNLQKKVDAHWISNNNARGTVRGPFNSGKRLYTLGITELCRVWGGEGISEWWEEV